jgi:hypothetical protein
MKTRVYEVHRKKDVSGVSGTGHVADAVVFEDGTTVLRWRVPRKASTAIYASLENAVEVHGHDGKTQFRLVSE